MSRNTGFSYADPRKNLEDRLPDFEKTGTIPAQTRLKGKNAGLFESSQNVSIMRKIIYHVAVTFGGLIDELKIKLNPVIFGSGIGLFGDCRKKAELILIDSKVYESGVALLTYKVGK